MNDNWDFLLSEFRKLGGIADNICQKDGHMEVLSFLLIEIFAILFLLPSKLLIKVDDIYLEDNKLRIKKDGKYDEEIRNFFNFLSVDNFSWAHGGKETTELFEEGLSLFNSNLKELIKKYARLI